MADKNEVFEQYALLRLLEDHDLGKREYLDSFEFHLAQSPSLEFLAKEVQADIQQVQPRWITDGEKEDEDFDFYRDEPERVLVIQTEDILESRRNNLNHVLPKLPKGLAKDIKEFEKNTEYLYAQQFSSTEKIISGLKKALAQFKNNKTLQRLIIMHATRISPPISKREQKKVNTLKSKAKIAQEEQKLFYQLIKDIHNPKNKDNLPSLYKKLFSKLKNRNDDDLRGFLGDAKYERLRVKIRLHYLKENPDALKLPFEKISKHIDKTIRRMVTTELARDICEQLYQLYNKADQFYNAKDIKVMLDNYNDACKHFHGRILGPKGAFEKGGLYGPDGPFSGRTEDTIGPNTPPPPSAGMEDMPQGKDEEKENNEKKKIQLKIFDNKELGY